MSDYTIRRLDSRDELRQAVDFQRLIWGPDFDEVVPPVVFWFTARIGGVTAGAFDRSGMIGLLFGVTGWDGTRPVHWSDMLAVHPDARGRGIGFALKQYQRDRLLDLRVTTVRWTFDPLEARNAWLNFGRLGATSREYLRDVYGDSSSPLHQGIGTDRLVVDWRLDSDRVRRRMEPPATAAGATRSGPDAARPAAEAARSGAAHSGADAARTGAAPGRPADPHAAEADVPLINDPDGPLRLDLDANRVALRIPADIQRLKSEDPAAARRWREQTRSAFESYLARGYEVADVVRAGDGVRYVFERVS